MADLLTIQPWDGKPISKPGIYSGVPAEVYHGQLTVGPSVSRSMLWTLLDKSAKHLWKSHYLNPNRESEETEPMIFGRAAHHLLLGEKDFYRYFVIRPDTYRGDKGELKPWSGAAKVCKKWMADQKARGLTVITKAQLERIKGMAQGLWSEPMVREGILNGYIETTMVAKHKGTGIWMKVRPDAWPTDGWAFADLKTTADITEDGLEKAVGKSGLSLQGGMTGMVLEALGGKMSSYNFVFTESADPFCCAVRTMVDEDLKLGVDAVETAIKLYARCIERNEWLGPGGGQDDGKYITMRPFERKHIEVRIAQLERELAI